MAKLFYQVKEENFSAKLSNWQHPRYCGKIQIILFSMLASKHKYRKFDLFYFLDICVLQPDFSTGPMAPALYLKNSFQLYFVNTKAFVCFLTPFNGQKQTYIIQFYVRDHLRNSLRHSSVVSRFYLLIGKGGLRPFSQSLRIVNIDRHLLHGVSPTKLFCSYIRQLI